MESEVRPDCKNVSLNAAQKARMEKNRLKALTLKESKVLPRPSANIEEESCVLRVGGASYRDGGGGFLLDDEPLEPAAPPAPACAVPVDPERGPTRCLLCRERFCSSFLYDNFNHEVCNACRDPDGSHALITKTEAKSEFLLKDCDLESREPPLKYMERRNPHRRGGVMRLYLREHVEERARLAWGSDEALAAERRRREERRGNAAVAKYERELRALRKRVIGNKKTVAPCEHQYSETAISEDTYRAVCTLCHHTITYEKM